MKLFYAFAALLCLQLQPASAQEDAKQFLDTIYLTYVEGDGEGVPLEGPALRNTFVEDLAELIDADSKKGQLKRMTYDPLVDAEEWEISDIRISIRPISPTHAIGNVAFLNFEETSMMVNVDLVKTQVGWRVDDIQVPDGRLRDLFTGPDPEIEPAPPISGEAAPTDIPALATPVETAAPADEAKPVVEAKPAEEPKPTEQVTVVEPVEPTGDKKLIEATPSEEATVVGPVKPAEATKTTKPKAKAKLKSKPKKVAKPKPAPQPKPVEAIAAEAPKPPGNKLQIRKFN